MDPASIIIAVAAALLATATWLFVFSRRIRRALNEWAARKQALAEKEAKALAEKFKAETEAVDTALAALRSERMRAVATFRKSGKKTAFIEDDDEEEDAGDVAGWLGKMAENPIVRAMARKHDVDLDGLVAGDDDEWDRVDQILHGKSPKRRKDDADDQDAGAQQQPANTEKRVFL